MAEELIYTSAQRGLRPGTRGFCPVAYTRGMKPQTIQLLEALSAYRDLYSVHDSRARLGPVAYSHYHYVVSGVQLSLLSRVAPAMPDHTGRSNKMAHHVVLHKRELPAGGPAWLALQDGFFLDNWEGPPRYIETPRIVPTGDFEGTLAATWRDIAGDAGWAGMLAQHTLRTHGNAHATIIFEPGMPMLRLLSEAMALLDVPRRWQIAFSTYFTSLPAGAKCDWRCCLPDSDCVREARRNPKAFIIDLTNPGVLSEENMLVQCAREGSPLPKENTPREASSRGDRGGGFVRLPNRQKLRLRMRPQRPQEK